MPAIMTAMPTLDIPAKSIIGIQESWSFLGDNTIARTVNREAVAMKPVGHTLFGVRWSNSGDGVWNPNFDNLQFGFYRRVYTHDWQSAILIPGQTTLTLLRDAVPGSVNLRFAATAEPVPATVNVVGRNVTMSAAQNATVSVMYRYALECVVAGYTMDGSATGRDQGWTLDWEEKGL